MIDIQTPPYRDHNNINANDSIPFPSDDEQILLSLSLADLNPTGTKSDEWKKVLSKAQKKETRSPPLSPIPPQTQDSLPSPGSATTATKRSTKEKEDTTDQPQYASVISPHSISGK